MKLSEKLLGQLYGGWIGKIIGVIHGANIEGWPYEKIKKTFGVITDYPVRFKNFCADDDINGPVFFQRCLLDYDEINVENMAKTFLNYVSDGHGFFWWGGYGISTEHTSYQNLIDGIPAPLSGSIEQNGIILANQIGGQIFSDCWGMINPGNPAEAARLAGMMSSITHDGDGIQGGRFIAACIAQAYIAVSMDEIIETAYRLLQPESEYAQMVDDVRKFCNSHPQNWEEGFQYVKSKYDYKYYGGVCHIIPNAAVVVLAMMYGKGNFSDTINIANMCGWDTDCNVGNVGAIVGVFNGIEKVDKKWLSQVNDFVCASSSLGALNTQTVSQITECSIKIMKKYYGLEVDDLWEGILQKPEGKYLHFEFPTATHAIRGKADGEINIENIYGIAHKGNRSLRIMIPCIEKGQHFITYYKTYYEPSDFNDNRYCPDFSSSAYPGDYIKLYYRFDEEALGYEIKIKPHILERIHHADIPMKGEVIQVCDTEWHEFKYQIPEGGNWIIEEAGIEITVRNDAHKGKNSMTFYIDEFEIISHSDYQVICRELPLETWASVDFCPANMTFLRGVVELTEACLQYSYSGRTCETYTGNIQWRNIQVTARLIPKKGERHFLLLRVQGSQRWYGVGFSTNKQAVILKKDGNISILAQSSFEFELRTIYEIKGIANENEISIYINGAFVLKYIDNNHPYLSGCIGFGNDQRSRTALQEYSVKELL